MRKVPLILSLLLAFTAPRAALAQDDDDGPGTLVMSFHQCDWNRLGDVMEEFELSVPIWEEMVEEGLMSSAGTFVHAWADKWNVATYFIAESMEAGVAANDVAGERFTAAHPEANAYAEACPRHRDNFYQFGPVTDNESAPNDGNPTLAIAFWECDFGSISNILGQYEENTLPVNQALVDEGMLRGAGSFAHSWADEWNLAFYWVAEDIPSFLEAWGEAGRRNNAANPDAPNLVFENCTAHRDGIYTLGPRTGMDAEAEDEGGN